jgi:hypothetical protein
LVTVALNRVSWPTSASVRVGFMYRLRSPTFRQVSARLNVLAGVK